LPQLLPKISIGRAPPQSHSGSPKGRAPHIELGDVLYG
jgi:hypothetical protein